MYRNKKIFEYLWGLCYNIRVLDLIYKGPIYILDKISQWCVKYILCTTFWRKNQIITYRLIFKGVAKNELRVEYVRTHDNEAEFWQNYYRQGTRERGLFRIYSITYFSLRRWNYMSGLDKAWSNHSVIIGASNMNAKPLGICWLDCTSYDQTTKG